MSRNLDDIRNNPIRTTADLFRILSMVSVPNYIRPIKSGYHHIQVTDTWWDEVPDYSYRLGDSGWDINHREMSQLLREGWVQSRIDKDGHITYVLTRKAHAFVEEENYAADDTSYALEA